MSSSEKLKGKGNERKLPPDFRGLYQKWTAVIACGAALWALDNSTYSGEIGDFVMSLRYLPTHIALYMEYCYGWCFLLKGLFALQQYRAKVEWARYKWTVLRDLCALMCFLLIYRGFRVVWELWGFRPSGHAFLLILVSCLILCEMNDLKRVVYNIGLEALGNGLLVLNLYTVFWTSALYHPPLEVLVGFLTGLGVSYLIYFSRNN